MAIENPIQTLDQITERVGSLVKNPADRKTVRKILLENNLYAYRTKPNDIRSENRSKRIKCAEDHEIGHLISGAE